MSFASALAFGCPTAVESARIRLDWHFVSKFQQGITKEC
jgi:hypothetical protein